MSELTLLPKEATVGLFAELTRALKDGSGEAAMFCAQWALGSFTEDWARMVEKVGESPESDHLVRALVDVRKQNDVLRAKLWSLIVKWHELFRPKDEDQEPYYLGYKNASLACIAELRDVLSKEPSAEPPRSPVPSC